MSRQQGITLIEMLVTLAVTSIFLMLWSKQFAHLYSLQMRSLHQLQQEALLEDILTRMHHALRFVPELPLKIQETTRWCLVYAPPHTKDKAFQGIRFDFKTKIISMGHWHQPPKSCSGEGRWWALHTPTQLRVKAMDAEVFTTHIRIKMTTQNILYPEKTMTRTQTIFLHNAQ